MVFFKELLCMSVCMRAHVCSCDYSFIHMVIRQWELVRLSYLMGPGDQSQIIRLGSKCLHPPSHLAILLLSV